MNTSQNITMRLGETVKINFTVVEPDGGAKDLQGATAVFAISDGVLADKSCSIVGNVCTVTLDADDVDTVGTFGFEFRVTDSMQQVDSLLVGDIIVGEKHTTTM